MLCKFKLKIFCKTSLHISFATKNMAEPVPKVPTSSNIKAFWEDFGKIYSQIFDNSSQQSVYSLLINLKISEAKSIYEMSIGSGKSLPLVCSFKSKDCHFLASDISENLLHLSSKRMELIEQDFHGKLQFWNESSFEPSENKKYIEHFPQSNVSFRLLDNENLIGIPDNTFDVVFSNLSLQLVSNPEKMLSEALRVLKPGGRAGFTVWGRKELSKFFTTVPTVMRRNGFVLPQDRSNFHLGDKDKMISMVKTIGYVEVLAWYQFSAFCFTKEEEFEKIFHSKGNKRLLEMIPDEEQREKIKKEILEEYLSNIRNNEPVGLDVLYVIGRKGENIKENIEGEKLFKEKL